MTRPSLSASLRRSQTTQESEAARGTYRDAHAAKETARAKAELPVEPLPGRYLRAIDAAKQERAASAALYPTTKREIDR